MRYPRRWLTLWTWLFLGCIARTVGGISDSSMTEEEEIVLVTVEGVEGESASLPCDLNPTDPQDKVNLILWYKDEDKDPVYSFDARLAVFDSDRHHLKDLRLKGRISFSPSPGPPRPHILTLSRLSISDRGIYRCRVDFMRAQSRTVGAELRVVAPVESLIITDGEGQPVPPVLSPIAEGGTLNITCTAKGGRPQPKVSWWFGDAVIDDSWSAETNGVVTNTLVLSPLTRAHAHSVLVCKAATATVAVTTATVTIDMYLRPLQIDLTGAAVTGSVRAGDMLDLTCKARGSRPQPVISWYKGANLIHSENTDKKQVTGVGGVSQVREQVSRRDNGARVTCRVMNPALPRHTLQEHIVINVTYPPEVELRLGAPLKGSVVKENSNLYLTCHVDANPAPHTLVFMHQGQKVTADKGGKVLINGNNLVMNKVKRTQAGEYSCKATNSQGNATSAPLNVTVLYAPVCASSKDVWAEPGKTITTQCHVQAEPMKPLYFSWVWMTNSESRRIIPSHVSSEGSSSTVTFTVPKDNLTDIASSKELGVLQCWAENTVGRQDAPCVISVKKPSAPAAPRNCTRLDSGREVVMVNCQPGEPSTSMPHTYRLQVYQVYEGQKRKLIHNVSSSRPRFTVRGLTSGQDYAVYISSYTSFGRSPYHLVESFTYKAAENRMRSEDSMPSLSTIIMFVGGVAAIVAIVVIFVITVRIKMRKNSHKCIRRTATATDPVIPKKPPSLHEGLSAAGASSSALSTFPETSSVKRDSLHPKDALHLQSSHSKEPSPSSLATHHSSSSHHHSSQLPHTKEAIPLQPIIRQPSKPLQPIIKENGRSEKSSQGRTVLFVEPPKAQSGILVNKSEVPRNSYDVYPGRRRPMKDPNGDVKHSPYVHRGSYSDMRTSYGDHDNFSRYHEMELPPRRYRSLDDGEDCRGIMNRQYSPNSSARDLDYYPPYHTSMITSPPYSARELPTRDIREYGRDPRREMREHRALTREASRDHQREMVREMGRDRDLRDRDHMRDRDRDRDQGHVFAFPSRIASADYDQPTSIMKRSPSMSASVGRHYEKPMRRSDGGGTYRSLPRPSKSRGEAEEDVLRKYRSLDRRFDLPFSGSLPRPEPEPDPCEEQPPQHQRRYSGSPRLRFADEKHFHLYHDKEKKQSGVNDRDESFI